MSFLHLATDPEPLAARLAQEIARRQTPDNFLEPISVVIPNRFVAQWLRFRIARELGVAINLRFTFLEHALWEWLRAIDPREHSAPPELLDDDRYQLLVLAVLLKKDDPDLRPLQAFLRTPHGEPEDITKPLSRRASRQVWQLAQRLGSLIRDYEYHRQETIIQAWLTDTPALPDENFWSERESAQRAVFRHITREPEGMRFLLNQATKRNFKTLPQYVMELHYDVQEHRTPPREAIHLFGFAQISPLHLNALEILAPFHDWNVYHASPFVTRLPVRVTRGSLKKIAEDHRKPMVATTPDLLRLWGRAGAESLALTAAFLESSSMKVQKLPTESKITPPTVLNRLQTQLLGQEAENAAKLSQDVSLQIVACPGIWREVETVHESILRNLQRDPTLKQTDIGVLATDLELYRPALTAVFERPPRLVNFSLADFTAARVSMFGQALLGMLDLAQETFSRSRVFEVLLNPCFLARRQVDRAAAGTWLTWAEALGVHHGWDAGDKGELGYFPSPLFGWKLALQRLRLGRFMDVVSEDDQTPAPRWQDAIPFADVESLDREQLDPFCRAVEELLPILARLRNHQATAVEWAELVRSLTRRFLDVPEDRPEEGRVRDALLAALDRFEPWDSLHSNDRPPVPLSLALVREWIASQLGDIPARRNDLLAGGVTIAALQPQRPIPFRITYLVGMGEQHFPGGAALSPFDLRHAHRQAGDILPVEQKRYAFLEAILTTREKLVITYNQRDLQKDQDLQLAVPVTQLQRCLEKTILAGEMFHVVPIPLLGHDLAYLDSEAQPAYQDVIVRSRTSDRLLALDEALASRRMEKTQALEQTMAFRRSEFEPDFSVPKSSPTNRSTMPTVTTAMLSEFLLNPAKAAFRHHLKLWDKWEGEESDHEPLVSSKYQGAKFAENILRALVTRAETVPAQELTDSWKTTFGEKYQEWSLRGRFPEHAFGEIDREALEADVDASLESGLLAFLETMSHKTPCGPILLGESQTPLGAKRRFEALNLSLARPLATVSAGQARLVGTWPFAWEDDASLDLLVFGGEKEAKVRLLEKKLLEPFVFLLAMAASGALWLGTHSRRVTLHLVRPKWIEGLIIPEECLTPDAARTYLAMLVTDFLDPFCAEQFPFEKLLSTKSLLKMFVSPDELGLGDVLQEELFELEDEKWGFHADAIQKFSDAGFKVPDDAFAKARRRFVPLQAMIPQPPPEEASPEQPAKKPARKSPKKGGSK